MLDGLLRTGLALVPVFLFLIGLLALDTYKLLKPAKVLIAVAWGCIAAAICFFVNQYLLTAGGFSPGQYSLYVAPLIEESATFVLVFVLLATHRVGFQVDVAIAGFAVGAGFAAIENLYYLRELGEVGMSVWFVRGFGTAVMHGSTTALAGLLAMHFTDRREWPLAAAAPVGLAAAYVFHSMFNHFPLPPLPMTLAQLLLLPPVVYAVFSWSERQTRDWLSGGFDSDQELLKLITSEGTEGSPVGDYLDELKYQFEGRVVADMLCYLRLHVEVSIAAKGILLLREAGFDSEPPATLKTKFDELDYLRDSIGKTGLLALSPFLRASRTDLWQIHFVK